MDFVTGNTLPQQHKPKNKKPRSYAEGLSITFNNISPIWLDNKILNKLFLIQKLILLYPYLCRQGKSSSPKQIKNKSSFRRMRPSRRSRCCSWINPRSWRRQISSTPSCPHFRAWNHSKRASPYHKSTWWALCTAGYHQRRAHADSKWARDHGGGVGAADKGIGRGANGIGSSTRRAWINTIKDWNDWKRIKLHKKVR